MNVVRRKIEKVVLTETTVYVAPDGKEFKNRRDCEEYETDLIRKIALASNDVEVNKELNDCAPHFASYGWDDNNEYVWVRPKTEDGVALLKTAFKSDYSDSQFEIGKWMCVEIGFEDSIDLISEDDMKEAYVEQFGKLGIKVTFEEEKK